jgi:hypothetical protein
MISVQRQPRDGFSGDPMTTKLKLAAFVITFSSAFTLISQAQAPATNTNHPAAHKQTKKTATPSIETQIR